jgi:hypothetical protein
MSSKIFRSEIETIQKLSELLDDAELHQELEYFVESHPWRSLLIYGGLYVRRISSANISAFFARKTLETMEEVCGQKAEVGEKMRLVRHIHRWAEKLGIRSFLIRIQHSLKRRTISRTPAGEELLLARQRLDQLLVAVAFLVFAFEDAAMRAAIKSVEQITVKRVKRNKERFVDRVPLKDYLAILHEQLRDNKESIQPLDSFFDELIRTAGLGRTQSFEQRATRLKKCIELLIEEAGCRIEKPDRIFSYADSLDSISQYAEWLFDVGEERFFNKYKWAYPRGQSFNDLNAFWVACMIGLFAFDQAVDRSLALAQASKRAEGEAAATEADGREDSVMEVEQASQKEETQQSVILKDLGADPILRLAVSG